MEAEDLVPVYTVQSPPEAEMVRNALKEEGIACEIGGEGQAGLAGVLSIDILVHAGDADKAKKVLRTLRREKVERKKKRVAARKAKAEAPPPDTTSEAIQEKPPHKKPE